MDIKIEKLNNENLLSENLLSENLLLKKKLAALNKLNAEKKAKLKIAQTKYFKSDKGRLAKHRTYKKNYKPTGNKAGRPRKNNNNKILCECGKSFASCKTIYVHRKKCAFKNPAPKKPEQTILEDERRIERLFEDLKIDKERLFEEKEEDTRETKPSMATTD
jgi:hypothetical protein